MYDEVIDLEQASALLHLGIDATRKLIDLGELPALRLNQKHTVLLREDVIEFIRTEGRRQAEERRKQATQTSAFSCRRQRPDLSKYE